MSCVAKAADLCFVSAIIAWSIITRDERGMKRDVWKPLVVVLIIAVLVAICVEYARAHEAKAGWTYPQTCCSDQDCKEVSDSAIVPTPEGWFVKSTGEFIPQTRARMSKDGRFHRCSPQGKDDTKTFCLFVPNFGT